MTQGRKPTPFATDAVLDGLQIAIELALERVGWKSGDELKVQRAHSWLIEAKRQRRNRAQDELALARTRKLLEEHELDLRERVREDDR